DPNAWMAAFPWLDPKEVNEAIVQHVRDRESEYREIREEKKGSVIGARRLMLQPIDTPYYPKKRGRKMWCICSDVELRKMYIAAVKALVEQAREVYKRWKLGDYSLSYPIGLFAPARPKVAHRIGGVVSFY
ncbi:MAG: hypothetical protein KDD42_06640, partial [Bdellovibrionales bacterium]|nr:hypothetical protein [Bdellovibrionales bacterium]